MAEVLIDSLYKLEILRLVHRQSPLRMYGLFVQSRTYETAAIPYIGCHMLTLRGSFRPFVGLFERPETEYLRIQPIGIDHRVHTVGHIVGTALQKGIYQFIHDGSVVERAVAGKPEYNILTLQTKGSGTIEKPSENIALFSPEKAIPRPLHDRCQKIVALFVTCEENQPIDSLAAAESVQLMQYHLSSQNLFEYFSGQPARIASGL